MIFLIPEYLIIIFVDKRQGSIMVVSPSYQVTRSMGREGKKPGCLSYPTSLVVDRRGRLIVSENGNERIQVEIYNIMSTDMCTVYYTGSGHRWHPCVIHRS